MLLPLCSLNVQTLLVVLFVFFFLVFAFIVYLAKIWGLSGLVYSATLCGQGAVIMRGTSISLLVSFSDSLHLQLSVFEMMQHGDSFFTESYRNQLCISLPFKRSLFLG